MPSNAIKNWNKLFLAIKIIIAQAVVLHFLIVSSLRTSERMKANVCNKFTRKRLLRRFVHINWMK